MLHTNKIGRCALALLFGTICFPISSSVSLAAEQVKLHKGLTAHEARCLRKLFHRRTIRDSESEINQFILETTVGRAHLRNSGQRHYIFLVHNTGYCGSAGCLMLIGERRQDGRCRLLHEGTGASETMVVLNRRDHGYRRLYTPCEIRFNGHEYRQVRWQCPTLDIQR
jgi:hypothetical protein